MSRWGPLKRRTWPGLILNYAWPGNVWKTRVLEYGDAVVLRYPYVSLTVGIVWPFPRDRGEGGPRKAVSGVGELVRVIASERNARAV